MKTHGIVLWLAMAAACFGKSEAGGQERNWPDFRLQGIVGMGKAGSALVDGRAFPVGSVIGEFTIVDVTARGAVVEYKGERRLVRVGAGGGERKPDAGRKPEAKAAANARMADLLGPRLVDANRQSMEATKLGAQKVGIYFSAEWCPPCRQFTPKLVEAYGQMKKAGKSFEVVFASNDRSEGDMFGYMKKYGMPWKAIPFESETRSQLGSRFGVRGIPTLIVVDSAGKVLSSNGRGDIEAKGAAAYDGW